MDHLGREMSKRIKVSPCLLSFLAVVASVSTLVAAEVRDTGVTVATESGQVIQRSLTPNGQVTDRLPYAENEILVRFKDAVPASRKQSLHRRVRAGVIKSFRHVRNLELLGLPRELSVEQALKSYRNNPDVLYAEPNYFVETLGAPNDSSFVTQWGLRNTGQNGGTPGADIKAVQAWNTTTGSVNVVVAVIDTGVDYNHQDLAANIWRNEADCNSNGIDDDGNGYIDDCHGIDTANGDSDPMDDNDHGTHVAGTIGAVGNNSLGVVGVNWNVKIMACKFLDAGGSGSVAGAIACMDYVKTMKDRGVDIVATNNSWGGAGFSQALSDAIEAHRQRDILFIAAAGNSATDNDAVTFYPAGYYLPSVISVAATDKFDRLAFFSSYGAASVHVGAPGAEILSTTTNNTYASFSGTSMATPHVTGLAALLKAQNPARDWRAIKNLILAGGKRNSFLNSRTLTGRRLNAAGSLHCSDASVLGRVWPRENQLNIGLVPVNLSALHIKCAKPSGGVAVKVSPGQKTVKLKDDGLGTDQAAGDGIYSGQWTPSSAGSFKLTFPDGDVVTVNVDADLEPGFPAKAFHGSGSYHGGAAVHSLVGTVDGDPQLEIVATALSSGPLYAWRSDGSELGGWPLNDFFGAAYPALGELSASSTGWEVAAGHFEFAAKVAAYSGAGASLPGWPLTGANYTATPPSLADVDGDGIDEIFIEEEDWQLHAYKADGTPLAGWPVYAPLGGQERHTPAIADLDGDGDPEIITASGWSSGVVYLFAYHNDGTPVQNFPISFSGKVDTFPVVADLDGDGTPEIVFVAQVSGPPWHDLIYIVSSTGTIVRTIDATGSSPYGTAPALADLDGDGLPEIIVQTEQALNVFRADGSTFPGWPVTWSSRWLGNSAPVVGDVDGDQLPDIVVTTQLPGSSENGEVLVYNRNGVLHPRFPKTLKIGAGAAPAIADLDLDGRNEIIVTGSFWNGISGDFSKVWVYDLGGPAHGPIEWGQFMGGPKHQGYYPVGNTAP